jgi:hypothetical protein
MASAAPSSYPIVGGINGDLRPKTETRERTATWTKRPRFPGQATFDLSNDMKQLPFSKPMDKSSGTDSVQMEGYRDGVACLSCGRTGSSCACDGLMKELNEMQQETEKTKCPVPPYFRSESLPENVLLTPERCPITSELINEVREIYAALVMVEKKCIQISLQLISTTNKLSDEQWGALFALQRTLLHEHHDFYLACHHPLASTALRGLARKYAMTARMWEHGLNGFLKILCKQMPGTNEHMLAYLDHAYSVLEDLQQHVPSLSTDWSECLKGLDVYRDELQRFRDQEQRSGVTGISTFGQTSGVAPELVRTRRIILIGATLEQLGRYGMGWHCCSSRLSGWDNEQGTVSFCPHYPRHDYQSMSESYSTGVGAISVPDTPYEEVDWCDYFQPAYQATASSSSSSSHTTADHQEFNAQNPHDPPNNDKPWGIELSHIAILVLVGWLFVGQASSLDFNIFVKVFCILSLPNLE